MATRYVRRGSTLVGQAGFPSANSIRVHSTTEVLKFGTGASGTTEKEAVDLTSTQTITGAKTFSTQPVFSGDGGIQYAEVTISSAQVLALFGTPITLVASPGAGKVLVPLRCAIVLDFVEAAYAGIAAGEDLAIRYTNAAGVICLTVEATGFLDQASDQIRLGAIDAAAAAAIVPVAASPLVLHMTTGDVITGDSPLRVKLWYSVFSTGL